MTAAVNEDNPINLIPQHLFIEEILVRLPVKTLVRFKIVCKEWNSIISSRDFAELHLNFSKSKPSYDELNTLFLCAKNDCILIKYKTIKDIEIDDDIRYRLSDNWYGVVIPEFPLLENETIPEFMRSECLLDSCNGLVCFYIADVYCTNFFYIWNPYTNHFKHVFSPNHFTFYIGVAGFFYVENDYKIVAFGFTSSSNTKWGGVYSLNTNLWTEIPLQNLQFDIGLTSYQKFYSPWIRGVKVEEMLYWKITDDSDYNNIVGFNIKDYTFRQLLPSSSTNPKPYWCHMTIRNIGGSLCSCDHGFHNQLEIWRFEYKENSLELWTLMFKLNLEGFEQQLLDFIGCTKDGKIIVKNKIFQLFVVNPNEDHTTVESIENESYFEAIKFNASLVSPCHYTKQDTEEEIYEALYCRYYYY